MPVPATLPVLQPHSLVCSFALQPLSSRMQQFHATRQRAVRPSLKYRSLRTPCAQVRPDRFDAEVANDFLL
jgi:hypothetical protein